VMWCMERITIYLTEELRAALDVRARAEGLSRAETIRSLLSRSLASDVDDLEADLAAIDGAFGVLSDEDIAIDRSDGARASPGPDRGSVILVDSDVLIATLRGLPQARDWLRAARVRSGRAGQVGG
jgi:Ribbon-helix-helix protein, copG family.